MLLNRNIAPEFREISNIEITQAETTILDNGIPLHTLRAGTESVIRLEFIFKAGHWYEAQNGVSYFTTKLLSAGTSNFSSKEIEEQIAQYGAFLDLGTGYDRCSLTVYSLSKYLDKILPLLFEMISESTFPEDEIENLKKISAQNLKVNQKKTSFLASKNFRELLFGKDHPYGRTVDENAIAGVHQDDLKKHYTNRFSYKNCDIFISGNGSEDFHKVINKHLGSQMWGTPEEGEKTHISSPASHQNLLIKNAESVQSSIRMGLPLFPISHPDYFRLNLLIEILGGYFGSRLMRNIREEKGYTYGISAGFHSLKHAGYLAIGTDVNKENTLNTIKEIHKEINILKSELISMEELQNVTNYLTGSFVSSLSTPFGLGDKFKTIYYHSLNYDFYTSYINTLKTITPAMLNETANKYFQNERILEVVAGDK